MAVSMRGLKRSNLFVILTVVLTLFLGLFSSSNAVAADVDASSLIGKNDTLVSAVVSNINAAEGLDLLSYDASTGILTFSNSEYSKLESSRKREYMKTALDSIEKSDLAQQRKSKMYNFVYEQDEGTTAAIRQFSSDSRVDTMGAFALLKPFNGAIGIGLGLLAVTIFLFMGIGFVIDISYMELPFFRLLNPSSDKKPMFITDAAYHAVIASEQTSGSGNFRVPMGIYLKKRIPSVILVSVALMYLISGNLFNFIGTVADTLMGLLSGD